MKNKIINGIIPKILISTLIVVTSIFAVPVYSQAETLVIKDEAGTGFDFLGDLGKELSKLVLGLGDFLYEKINQFMLGGEMTAMLDKNDDNLKDTRSWLYPDHSKVDNYVQVYSKNLDASILFGFGKDDWKIPNFLYSPENIFANNIPMLDVNFLATNRTYNSIDVNDTTSDVKSISQDLSDTISSWYKGFRNIAIVGLLTVLIYLGIRIVISTAASEKAQYKQSIQGWLIALVIVFILQFIMAGIIVLTESVIGLFADTATQGIIVQVLDDSGNVTTEFTTNLIGYIRFMAYSHNAANVVSYTVMYIALIAYTVLFTFTYLKRVLYMAFYTMISPLVALTYPIDKAGDGKAQAFNMWFKEFTMNAIIQPVHLILYTMLISSVMMISVKNPLYGIVAIGFLIPAEKFIKKLFGMEADTVADTGSVAAGAGALAGYAGGKAISAVSGKLGSGKQGAGSGNGNNGNNGGNGGSTNSRPRSASNGTSSDISLSDVNLDGNNGGNNNGALPSGEPGDNRTNKTSGQMRLFDSDNPDSNYINGLNETEQMQLFGMDHNNTNSIGSGNSINRTNGQGQSIASNGSTNQLGQQTPSDKKKIDSIKSWYNGDGNNKFSRGSARAARIASGKIKTVTPFLRDEKGDLSLKETVKSGAKAGAAVTVGGAAGIIAAGVTLSTGDPSKVLTRSLGATGTGALIGSKAGGTVASKIYDSGEKTKNDFYTDQEKMQKAADKWDKDWAKEQNNIDYLLRVDPNIKNKDEAQGWLKADETKEYLRNDITDVNTIYNARKLEQEKGMQRQHAIALAREAEKMKVIKGSAQEREAYKKELIEAHGKEKADGLYNAVRYIQKNN